MSKQKLCNGHLGEQTIKVTSIFVRMILLIVVAFVHNPFHEFGHWLAGTILGNKMSMNFNGVWVTGGGSFLHEWHSPVMGIGGPAFSILMACVALIVIEKYKTIYAFPFLIYPFVSRLFSLALGGFAKQDEAGVAASLGLGKYTVAVVVLMILGALLMRGSYTLKLKFLDIGPWSLGSVTANLLVIAAIQMFI